jgi:hypothetical protein
MDENFCLITWRMADLFPPFATWNIIFVDGLALAYNILIICSPSFKEMIIKTCVTWKRDHISV